MEKSMTQSDGGKMDDIGAIIKEKERLKKKLGEKCVYCGCENSLVLTIDHKKPLVTGGADTEENKQVVCYTCNQLKGAMNDKEFKEYFEALKQMRKEYKIKLKMTPPVVIFKNGMMNQMTEIDKLLDKIKSYALKKGEAKNWVLHTGDIVINKSVFKEIRKKYGG
jgi:hypothetical protein